MYKTVELFVARLTEVEKIIIRHATSEDRMNYLFYANHAFEIDLKPEAGLKLFYKAREILMADFIKASEALVFGNTWKF